MSELDPISKHFLDRAIQANFALWSTLLTVNGIIISAFALLRTLKPAASPVLVSLLVACAAISVLLIVVNFLVTKRHFQVTGRRLSSEPVELTEAQKDEELRVARRKNRNTQRRETAVLVLLVLEMAFVIAVLATSEGS